MLLLLLSACTPVSTIERSPGSREAVCDGLDEDGDGWVDEGVFTMDLVFPDGRQADGTSAFLSYVVFPQEHRSEGIRRVTTWTDDGSSILETEYDTQGRIVFTGSEQGHATETWQRLTTIEYGPYGETYQETRHEVQSQAGGAFELDSLVATETGWEQAGLRKVEIVTNDGVWQQTATTETDEQGKTVFYRRESTSECRQYRYERDDDALSVTTLVDDDCSEDWSVHGTVFYNTDGQPVTDSDGSFVFTWEDGLLTRYESAKDLLVNSYSEGRMSRTERLFEGELVRESTLKYGANGLPSVQVFREDYTGDASLELMRDLVTNEAGELTEIRDQSNSEDLYQGRTVYMSGSHRNLSSSYVPGGVTTHYSFDCHPPQ